MSRQTKGQAALQDLRSLANQPDEQFAPVCSHQGLERYLIARLSGEHQSCLCCQACER